MTWTTGFALPKGRLYFSWVEERLFEFAESRCLGEDGLQSAAASVDSW
jgi:hypothetical protein